jgi:hypothetical protein
MNSPGAFTRWIAPLLDLTLAGSDREPLNPPPFVIVGQGLVETVYILHPKTAIASNRSLLRRYVRYPDPGGPGLGLAEMTAS